MDAWDLNNFANQEKTSVYSFKRGLWFDGPKLPDVLIVTYTKTSTLYCATGLNRTSAIFVGVGESRKGVFAYNFATDIWSQMLNAPKEIDWCTCSSLHNKNNQQQ